MSDSFSCMSDQSEQLYFNSITEFDIRVLVGKLHVDFVCLFDFILYVPSTIFQLNRDESSWVEPVLS